MKKKLLLVIAMALVLVLACSAGALAISAGPDVGGPYTTEKNTSVTIDGDFTTVDAGWYAMGTSDTDLGTHVNASALANITLHYPYMPDLDVTGVQTEDLAVYFSVDNTSFSVVSDTSMATVYVGSDNASLTVTPPTDSYIYGQSRSGSDPVNITVYTTATGEITLTLTPAADATFTEGSSSMGVVVDSVAGANVSILPENANPEDEQDYIIKAVHVDTSIDGVFKDEDGTAPYDEDASHAIAVDFDDDVVYVTVESDAGATISVVGGTKGTPVDDVYPITLTGTAPELTVVVRYGETTFAEESWTLLRPILTKIQVNDANSSTGDDTVTLGSTTTATYIVDADWHTTVYLNIEDWLLNDDDDVEIYSVRVDGSSASTTSGFAQYYFRMEDPVHTLTIQVRAGNGDTGYVTQTYIVYFQSEDYEGGSLSSFYANDTYSTSGSYTVVLDNENDKIYIYIPYENRNEDYYYFKGSAEDCDVEYDGHEAAGSGSYKGWYRSDDLDVVTVIDEYDFETEYDVVLIQVPDDADDDADLDDLVVKNGSSNSSSRLSVVTLSPAFSSSATTYTLYVDDEDEYVNFKPTLSDSSADVYLNGKLISNRSTTSIYTLEEGKNTFEFLVVAEDGETTETYTVNIFLGYGTQLSSLTVSGLAASMTPAFDSNRVSYTGYALSSTSAVTVAAVAYSDDATVTVSGGSAGYKTGTGSATASISLAEGMNTVMVTVYEKGVGTSVYYISIYRQPAAPKIVVSQQSITVNGTSKTLTAYNINGNNFIQLRDLAVLLNNTAKQFAISFNDSTQTAYMTGSSAYLPNGTENAAIANYKKAIVSTQHFYYNSTAVYPMAYNIDGSNYVMIRDLASIMDFGVSYNSTTNTISVSTSSSYLPTK